MAIPIAEPSVTDDGAGPGTLGDGRSRGNRL